MIICFLLAVSFFGGLFSIIIYVMNVLFFVCGKMVRRGDEQLLVRHSFVSHAKARRGVTGTFSAYGQYILRGLISMI